MNPVFLSAVGDTGLTMASVLSTITEVFTAAVGWVGTVAETVAGNPLLLVGVVIGFIGTGIGLFSRLLRVCPRTFVTEGGGV